MPVCTNKKKEKELTEVKNRANENVLFHLYKTEQEKITLCLILMIMKMIHAKNI